MSDNNKPQEWHPDSDTQIIDEQTIISPVSFELCSKKIVEIITVKRQLKRSRGELICSQLDVLLAKSVGALEPSTKTLFGLENKAFKNTQNRLKLATIIADEVRLQLDKILAGEVKKIALKSIDGWLSTFTPQQQASQPKPCRKPTSTPLTLPQELDNDTAKKYFARAIEKGLMNKQYKWLKSQLLLAFFAQEMSLKLGLGKGFTNNKTPRLSWQPFETLFGIEKGHLRQSMNDYKKDLQEPIGLEKVLEIFQD